MFVKFRATKLTVGIIAKLYYLVEKNRYQLIVWATETKDNHQIDDGTTPIPWDTSVRIEEDKEGVEQLVLEGGAGPSGFGSVVVKLPLKDAGDYAISIDNYSGKVEEEFPDWLVALHDEELKH